MRPTPDSSPGAVTALGPTLVAALMLAVAACGGSIRYPNAVDATLAEETLLRVLDAP